MIALAEFALEEIEAIVFDVNGTLLYGGQMYHYHVLARLLNRKLSLVREVFDALAPDYEIGMKPLDRMQRATLALGWRLTVSELNYLIRVEAYFAGSPWRKYRGALQQLRRLKVHFKVGICSNQNPIGLAVSRFYGLDLPLVDAAVFSCVFGRAKPNPLIFAETCQRLNVPRTRCLFVGDGGSQELVGAREAGMKTMRVMQKGGYAYDNPGHPDLRADYELSHISLLARGLGVPAL